MTKTLKKSVAFLSATVMVMAMLLYFPSGFFSSIDWGLKASAVSYTLKKPEGNGSKENPYKIETTEELLYFSACVDGGYGGIDLNTAACAVLTDDITVNSNVLNSDGTLAGNTNDFIDWTPIGNDSNIYTGTFDGQNHKISGLYFNHSGTNYVGLFGYVGSGGSVSNVGIVDSYFKGSDNVGSVCGYNHSGTITNCYNTGNVNATGKNASVGGVCGFNLNGTITSCYNTGEVTATGSNAFVGGVCGFNSGYGEVPENYNTITNCYYKATITNCYNTGTVSSSYYAGGVCGYNKAMNNIDHYYANVYYGTAEITNCYNTGAVSGSSSAGGVCGNNYSNDGKKATITNCYNKGNVSGTENAGGVCGFNSGFYGTAEISNCYNTGVVSGSGSVGGVCGYNQNYDGTATITSCYNKGNVSGTENAGGVCGRNYNGTMANCYYNSTVYSTGNPVGVNDGGTVGENVLGKTTDKFNIGEVAFLLSQGCTVNETTYSGLYWIQPVDEDYPVLSKIGLKQPEISDNVYQIGTAEELYWFAALINGDKRVSTEAGAQNTSANAVLTANIDLSGTGNWTPIGNETNQYTGTFDGRNHTIKDMSITKQGNNSGLFGYIANATIKNITISGKITIIAESYTEGYGSIAGRMDNSTVINCHSSVNITITEDSAIDATKNNCIGHIGGIVGKMHKENSAISDCSYSGTIELNDRPVNVAAGIAGYAIYSAVPITNCSFTGTIHSTYSGATIIGGIFGYTNRSADVKVTNCLSVGTISKSEDISLTGILIGQINSGYGNNAVKNNYYSSSSSLGVFGTITGTPSTTPAEACTTDELNSGKIAYLLSQGENGSVWGQTLGTDNYPVLDSTKKVLANSDKTKFANDIIVYGQSATLDGMIGMNIYVAADDNYEWSASFNGTEVTIPEKDENGLYKFTYQVAAKDMEQEIVFSINGEEKAKVTVKAYLAGLKASSESGSQTEETAKLVELVDAMETYGNAANEFFADGGTVQPVGGVEAADLAEFEFTKNTETFPAGISYYGSSLLLKSETIVRHYFKLEGVQDITNFAFTVKVGDAEYSTVTPVEKSGYYYIDIENISADKLNTPHTVKIGDVEVISNYSALSYAETVLSSETANDNLKNLVKTLYLYNQKANALSGTQSSN